MRLHIIFLPIFLCFAVGSSMAATATSQEGYSQHNAAVSDSVILVAQATLSREQIRLTQELLTGFGFNPGPLDGLMGSRTRSSISDFQRAMRLEVNGVASMELLQTLRTHSPVNQLAIGNCISDLITAADRYQAKILSPSGSYHAFSHIRPKFSRSLTIPREH